MAVLSTKILTKTQKELFNDSGMDVIDYDAISIEFLDFEAPQFVKNGIFTSQNAVRSILGKNIQISRAKLLMNQGRSDDMMPEGVPIGVTETGYFQIVDGFVVIDDGTEE